MFYKDRQKNLSPNGPFFWLANVIGILAMIPYEDERQIL
jgi:hypothetical protein